MESAHEFFAESFEGVFTTEAEAERFALASQQRLWALVVVRHQITDACVHIIPAGWAILLPACTACEQSVPTCAGAQHDECFAQFHEGPSHIGTTDYTIRMNYTTVPRTWVKVDK